MNAHLRLHSLLLAGAALTLAGCATQTRALEKLPFHIAIAAPVVVADEEIESRRREGSPTEMKLSIDADALGRQLSTTLGGTFMQVTLLPDGPRGDVRELAQQAQRIGADLLLRPTLTYAPSVNSSTNDRFWLNLPLFALGGPFGWLVSDRSYYCDSELTGDLFDVAVAATISTQRGVVEEGARVLDITRPAKESSNNFLTRADGVTPYFLSLVVPAGLLAAESDATANAIDEDIVRQVSEAIAAGLLDRGNNILRWNGVSFYPRALQVEQQAGGRALTGELWLLLGAATAITEVRSRTQGGDWQVVPTETRSTEAADNGRGRIIYSFRAPLPAGYRGPVQLEVTQSDRFATQRTFTYLVE